MNVNIPDRWAVFIVIAVMAGAVGVAYFLATPGQLSTGQIADLASEVRTHAKRETGREIEEVPASMNSDMIMMGSNSARTKVEPTDDTRKKFRKKAEQPE